MAAFRLGRGDGARDADGSDATSIVSSRDRWRVPPSINEGLAPRGGVLTYLCQQPVVFTQDLSILCSDWNDCIYLRSPYQEVRVDPLRTAPPRLFFSAA